MSIGDSVSSFIRGIPSAYGESVEAHPLLESGLLGTVGAAAGYYFTPRIASKMMDIMYPTMSPEQKAQQLEAWEEDGFMDQLRYGGAAVLGGAGIAYPAIKNGDFSSKSNAVGSLVGGNAWRADNPEAMAAARKRSIDGKVSRRVINPSSESGRSRELEKTAASLMDPFNAMSQKLPLAYGKDLMRKDPFLTLDEKRVTYTLLDNAHDKTPGFGTITPKKIVGAALGMGASFSVARSIGETFGNMLNMPKNMTSRLSTAGGIAAAIDRTGFFKQLL